MLLTIEVSAVVEGDGVRHAPARPKAKCKADLGPQSKPDTRTYVTVEDLKSKIGTLVDGEQIRGRTKVLRDDQHEIQFGSFKKALRLRWEPVIFSFSFSSKEQKRGDPLAPVLARLEPLDIKAINPYIIGKTTHVVASKRNTAKGLEALINGRYIVTDAFVDAVVEAATPENPRGPESQAPLELDFDAAWPDPLQFLPAQSKEPSQRPAKFFAPNLSRRNIFEGYTFIFCDQTQFDNLQAPICNGGGKALLFTVTPGETTPDDIVRYVKSVAGEKGTGELEDGSQGKGVVVVRFRGKKEHEEWSIETGNEVAQTLDLRLIEQSEFLDAILINDARALRKSLPEDDDDILSPPPAAGMSFDTEPKTNANCLSSDS
jgi:hypothetical protein